MLKGISPASAKTQKVLGQNTMPNTVKQLTFLIGSAHFFRNFIPDPGQKILPLYKLLRKENV